MNLEHQVVNLELSQRLQKLGVKQESLFWWVWEHVNFKESLPSEPEREWRLIQEGSELPKQDEEISAFTVAELGEMLPYGYQVEITKRGEGTFNFSLVETKKGYTIFVEDGTEADARAKMLIYLIENKLITV